MKFELMLLWIVSSFAIWGCGDDAGSSDKDDLGDSYSRDSDLGDTGETDTETGKETADDPSIEHTVWSIDALENIGGHSTEVSGDPTLVSDDLGSAVMFDGDGDRLLVDNNPIDGATEFTVEIVFKPNDVYPDNTEPRFFHIESEENEDLRLTIELRLNDAAEWSLDTYIKAESSNLTLLDESITHPVDAWAHAAVTYKDQVMTSYVNGVQELSGEVTYLPIPSTAKSSIGARMNEVDWFNGAVAYVAFTHQALTPDQFAILDKI